MTQTHRDFERLALRFLEQYPELHVEWRKIEDIGGGRTDLVISPGKESEAFASLKEGQITVGTRTHSRDFETFGRKMSQEQLATEALEYFATLILAGRSSMGGAQRRE